MASDNKSPCASVLLVRHGNTFELNEEAVWVGTRPNLRLTTFGEGQALALANALNHCSIRPSRVVTSSLERTLQTARILRDTLGISKLDCDPRLDELDFGLWTGLTNEAVARTLGEENLRNWDEFSIWPENAAWGSSYEQVARELVSLLDDLKAGDGQAILVTHMGKLRCLWRLLAEGTSLPSSSGRVRTGHLCKISLDRHEKWKVDYWDRAPESLLA